MIGDNLCSRQDEFRANEVNVAMHVLNRISKLRQPSYVRIA